MSSVQGIIRGWRSGLEKELIKQLKKAGVAAEYEPFKMPYLIPESKHTYTPDFVLPNGIVIESKGRFTLDDRKKHLYLKEQYPYLDLRFVFSNSRGKIRKGSKTTYADWCEKNGFEYADKTIPRDWLKARKNHKSLREIENFRK